MTATPSRAMRGSCAAVSRVLPLLFLLQCAARKHELVISGDNRVAFSIEPFGFVAGGEMEFTVKNFKLDSTDAAEPFQLGFIARRTDSASSASSKLLQDLETNTCSLVAEDDANIVFTMNDPSEWAEEKHFAHQFSLADAGLYDFEFERCQPSGLEATVSFELDATFKNPGPNYLSAGEAPLPFIFLGFASLFYVSLFYWLFFLARNRKNVHKIHLIMAALLFVKATSLIFDAVTYHFIKVRGHPIGWNYVDDIVKAIKGMMMFGVILLIGTGWSFLKPFFSQREKRVVCIVIPLQIIANIAMIWLEESAPGSQEWITWKDILALADIICCCAVLFPIVWSIRHLRDASQADGKVNINLLKLKQFRHFYVMVVSYIYFTRIVVFLLRNTLPYKLQWFSSVSRELATLVFYTVTGYYFRPVSDNPYLRLRTAEACDSEPASAIEMTEQEFGLGDSGPV